MLSYSSKSKSGKYFHFFLIWGLYFISLCGAEDIPVLVKECDGRDPELRASECSVFGQHAFNGTAGGHC